MPANTPTRGLPYPLPADSINVPRDVQALADAIDLNLGRTPAKVFATKAVLDAEGATWPDGSMAQAPVGVAYTKVGGAWQLNAEQGALPIPFFPLTMGNVPPGMTAFPGAWTFPSAPFARIWRGVSTVICQDHSAQGTIRLRCRRSSDNVDIAISGTQSYRVGSYDTHVAIWSLLLAANSPALQCYMVAEVGGSGSNTNTGGGIMWEGYATTGGSA